MHRKTPTASCSRVRYQICVVPPRPDLLDPLQNLSPYGRATQVQHNDKKSMTCLMSILYVLSVLFSFPYTVAISNELCHDFIYSQNMFGSRHPTNNSFKVLNAAMPTFVFISLQLSVLILSITVIVGTCEYIRTRNGEIDACSLAPWI